MTNQTVVPIEEMSRTVDLGREGEAFVSIQGATVVSMFDGGGDALILLELPVHAPFADDDHPFVSLTSHEARHLAQALIEVSMVMDPAHAGRTE